MRIAKTASILGLVALHSGCGVQELNEWTERAEALPERREFLGYSPVVASTDFRATEHRIQFEVEAIYRARGVRREVVKREFREHDPYVEVGEIALGLVLAPLVVATIPLHFVIIGPLLSARSGRHDVIDWVATIPEVLLDPTENDLFPSRPEVEIASTREEPYDETVSELHRADPGAGVGLAVLRVRMAFDDGTAEDLDAERYHLERDTLVLPDPPSGIVSYEIDLAFDQARETVTVATE